jgi:putative inorganic carbon (hco3(-)) transporter
MSIAGSQSSPAVSRSTGVSASGRPSFDLRDALPAVALLLCGTVFYAAPWPALWLPALVVTAAFAAIYPIQSLVLVPAFAPFFMQPKQIHGSLHPAPQEVFLLVAFLALLIAWLRGRAAPDWSALTRTRLLIPALLFALAATVSAATALDRHLAFRALYQVVYEPLVYGALVLLFVRDARQWSLILCSVFASGIVVSCVAVGQAIAQPGHSLSPVANFQHAVGFYGSPDNLGLLLDRLIPFWLALVLFSPLRGRWRAALVAAGVPLCLGLLYSYSRGAWLAIGAVIVALLIVRGGWIRYAAIALVVLAGVASLAKAQTVVHSLQTGHAGTGQKRIDVWRSSLHMIQDHPIVGVGPDNFNTYYAPRHSQQLYTQDNCWGKGYIIEPGASDEPCLSHPHDEFLDFWLSSGILGLAAGIAAVAVFWWLLVAAWRRGTDDRWTRPLVLATGAAMAASLLHALVDNAYFLMDLSVFFWMLCILADWLAREPWQSRETPA